MFSCGQSSTKDSASESLKDMIPKTDSINTTSVLINKKLKESEITIKGAWGNDENGNAYFGIYDDSIYYPDPDLWYKYELISDTIVIYKEENTIEKIQILKLSSDSLVLFYPDYEITVTLLKR